MNNKTGSRMIFIPVMLMLLICLAGCGAAKQETAAPVPARSAPESSQPAPVNNKDGMALKAEDRKNIQTATLVLTTGSLKITEERILAIINGSQGRADEINVTQDDNSGKSIGHYILRVPQEQLGQVINSIVNLPDIAVQQRKTTSQDVTEEYVDINARLENLQQQEKRLRELLARANTLDETLKVENELVRVRTQIDSTAGKLKKMAGLIDMGTIKLTISENGVLVQNSFMYKIMETFKEGFQMAGYVVAGMIIFGIGLAPLAVLFYIYRRIKAARKKEHQ